MRILAFFSLSLKRLKSKLSLTTLLVLSVALTVGLMVCIPVFANNVARRMMAEELNRRTQSAHRAPFSVRYYAWPKATRPQGLSEAVYARDWLADRLRRTTGLPLQSSYMHLESPMGALRARAEDTRFTRRDIASVRVAYIEGIEKHVQTVAGDPIGQAPDQEGFLNVWVNRPFAEGLMLQPGDVFTVELTFSASDEPVRAHIAGIFEPTDPTERWWSWDPAQVLDGALVTSAEQYTRHMLPAVQEGFAFMSWYYVLDDSSMNLSQAPRYISALEKIARDVEALLPGGQMNDGPIAELKLGQSRKTALTVILLGFSLPLLGILVLFVASISAMLVRAQGQEIAMLSSRGGSKSQVLALMMQESLIILALGVPAGVALGLVLAWLLGYSFGFLSFAVSGPLRIEWAAVDWRLVAAAATLNVVARLIPGWLASRLNVLSHERSRARWEDGIGVARLLLLGLLVATTVYGYRQLAQRGTLGLVSWLPGDPSNDPLLLLAPSLFLFAAPFAAVELLMLLMRPLALLARALRSAGAYLGLMSVAREGGQYRLPLYMLVLALSLGVFYASLAKSADNWLLDRRHYEFGSDLTFKLFPDEEAAPINSLSLGAPTRKSASQEAQATIENPLFVPLSQYEAISGVTKATRVGDFKATTMLETPVEMRLLAVERIDFAKVVYYRADYATRPLGELMNRLGSTPDGILLPTELARRLQLGEGDALRLNVAFDAASLKDRALRQAFEFKIVGTFDYFPTMDPSQELMAVANLDYLQWESGGALPYGIWMRLATGAEGKQVLDGVFRLRVAPYQPRNLGETLARDQHRLERVGILGMVSICFLASALLAALGLVVFNAASLVRRATRFAVAQALGLGRKELLGSVIIEHLVLLVLGCLAGLVSGVAASRLYVPFFPLTETRTVPVPPFIPMIDWTRAGWLTIGMSATLALVEVALLARLAHARVFEVLRMGTRE